MVAAVTTHSIQLIWPNILEFLDRCLYSIMQTSASSSSVSARHMSKHVFLEETSEGWVLAKAAARHAPSSHKDPPV